ncbi:hypothetical protein G6F57_018503 [Rhizopus arrhizus]|nr:hypothetical protein G6F57_018503 [Rhizopus arrhizus]
MGALPLQAMATPLARIAERLRRDPILLLSLLAVIAIVLTALFAPWLAPHDPYATNMAIARKLPGWMSSDGITYLLGTDVQGRDILSRIIYGIRATLMLSPGGVLPAAGRRDHARRGRAAVVSGHPFRPEPVGAAGARHLVDGAGAGRVGHSGHGAHRARFRHGGDEAGIHGSGPCHGLRQLLPDHALPAAELLVHADDLRDPAAGPHDPAGFGAVVPGPGPAAAVRRAGQHGRRRPQVPADLPAHFHHTHDDDLLHRAGLQSAG